jgi:hypothetical protein
MRYAGLIALVLFLTNGLSVLDDETDAPAPSTTPATLRDRAVATADLGWLPAGHTSAVLVPGVTLTRPSLTAAKHQAAVQGDAAAVARANAVLGSEGFVRAEPVVRHWLDSRDPESGLLANYNGSDEAFGWAYQNTAADLFPFIAIGAHLLVPSRYPEMLAVLEAERRLAPMSPALPDDVLVPGAQQVNLPLDRRIFGIAEYAKDGLLPLVDRLGPDDWLPRLREIADLIVAASATPTPEGVIPAQTSEVNGDVLQVLARAYWMTGDDRYLAAATRIGNAYVKDALPKTTWLPPYQWDFMTSESIGRKRFHVSDHGDEIFSGLVEWNVAETYSNQPDAAVHRAAIHRMLDRVLATGRNDDGLWFRVIDIPTGKVTQQGLTDNWGYVFQPFMADAMLERGAPGGDVDRAERYDAAVRQALQALPRYRFYPWQQGEMDGYADSLESAVYLLSRQPDADAEQWLDEQVGVLFGFQQADGAVENNYLDGNFVRTSLLYSLSLTHGLVMDPWRPDVLLGAAVDGGCLEVAVGADQDWDGVLRFDRARSREYVHLPIDYPRLNEWPTGFLIDGAARWQILDRGAATTTTVDQGVLTAGLPIRLGGGQPVSLRFCPS